VLPYIGLGAEHFTSEKLEDNGQINLLKTGIYFSDAITTVSPTHAREILEPVGGQGLAPYLNNRRADLFGILNGVDYDDWNPATDKLIPATFSSKNLRGKATCKRALQDRFGLNPDPTRPVFGIVSRFAYQKGFGLLTQILPYALSQMRMQFVVLGTGDKDTEDYFHWLTATHPGQVGSYIGFSNELSHLVEAGSDFFLMPSLYEPCGLNQIYSLKYGTLPIVRATGGLADTVENYSEATGDGTGFVFGSATPAALFDTIGWAVSTYFDRPQHIARMQKKAMALDFSWPKAAREYETVYAHAIRNRRL
ncbi:MAG: glycogen/starch synthase, partial [Armatimonadota bacterium]|nr:glycogen/starch synthase [Armatimonadota bacterium]